MIRLFTFVSLFAAISAQAGYPTLPSSGCPANGEFNLDHYAELVPLSGCQNSAINNLSSRIIRGGTPFQAGLQCLHSSGVTAIIDLRKEAEQATEPATAENLGLNYYPFPMTADSRNVPSKECLVQKLTPSQCNEQSALRAIKKIESILTSDPHAKVYIHCSRGQDRTGLMIGLFRLLEAKCSATAARNEMEDFMYNPYASLEQVWKKYQNQSN